ncbi:hypothetical protein GCM10010910_07780 [Microbacterium nanhaiense]|uniref:Uncharacterized protein n=1 Tax=Microbacterium nanhaiense TaxID=1301026 RepID=A0ABQ2MZ49_9MICO|nr:hypothetical protein GCM10010910_07780 [Microbacterium nanhaiense]
MQCGTSTRYRSVSDGEDGVRELRENTAGKTRAEVPQARAAGDELCSADEYVERASEDYDPDQITIAYRRDPIDSRTGCAAGESTVH